MLPKFPMADSGLFAGEWPISSVNGKLTGCMGLLTGHKAGIGVEMSTFML